MKRSLPVFELFCLLQTAILMTNANLTSFPDSRLKFLFADYDDVTPDIDNPFDQEDIIEVNLDSHYCRQSTNFGRLCDYSETNQTIKIPTGLKYSHDMMPAFRPFIELRIQNATALHIYPTCISWIQAVRIQYLTTFPIESQKRSVEDCRTWLRIYDSKADEISYGILDLSLVNSAVSKINLKNQRDIMSLNSIINHIEWIDWQGYEGHMGNTTIKRITKLKAQSTLTIVNSNIGTLEHDSVILNGSECLIYNTNFDVIHSRGLTFLSELNELKNITINRLQEYGIVTGMLASLTMSNVVILDAKPPAFSFYFLEKVKIENVTIAGEPLTLDSKWVVTSEADSTEISNDTKHCTWEDQTVTCNFESFIDNKIHFDFQKLGNVANVIIKNANFLKLVNPQCFTNLTIMHCNVTALTQSSHPDSLADCQSTLRAKNSHFEYLQSLYFSDLDFDKVHIELLNVVKVSYMHLKNCYVGVVESLTTVIGSRAFIKDSKVGEIMLATFNAPLRMANVSIRLISGRLKLNHPGESSMIMNSTFEYLPYKGVFIESGHLRLVDVKVEHMMEQSIYLEQNSSIGVNNSFAFPRFERESISVLNKNQVRLSFPVLPIKTSDWMIHVRLSESQLMSHSENTILINNLTLSSNVYCQKKGVYVHFLICDFQNNSMEVEVDISLSYNMLLKNILYLTLHPSCSTVVYLLNVSNGTYLPSDPSCSIFLHLTNSSLHHLNGAMRGLVITNSHIEIANPFGKIGTVLVSNSTISAIDRLEFSGIHEVVGSSINYVQRLVGLEDSVFWLTDSRIDRISTYGIELHEATISNSTIGSISLNGLTIGGKVRVVNTILEFLDKEAIYVSGLLTLTNVTILNGSLNSFSLAEEGFMKCKNVILNGKQISCRSIISSEKTTASPVNSTKRKDIEDSRIETAHSKITDPPNITNPPIRVESPVSKAPKNALDFESNEVKSEVKSTLKAHSMERQKATSITWVVGLLGFVVGAAFTVGIVYGYVLFRPDVQSMVPSIRWSVKDDENELMHSDDEHPMEENPP